MCILEIAMKASLATFFMQKIENISYSYFDGNNRKQFSLQF